VAAIASTSLLAPGDAYPSTSTAAAGADAAAAQQQEVAAAEEEPDYDEFTGAPLNLTAKQECVSKWRAAEAEEGCVRNLPYAEMQAATNGFSPLSRISEGASCQVFTGHLYGMFVAVKHLSANASEWDDLQFTAEMELLCHVSHWSICRLFAYSTDGPQRCLVLELCANGSLDSRIAQCTAGKATLEWGHRLRIMHTIAVALAHLHSLKPPMLHRDVSHRMLIRGGDDSRAHPCCVSLYILQVKTANVLLDDAMNAKVADFGTVHVGVSAGTQKTHLSTRQVAGTRGYMPPEYHMNGHVSEKTVTAVCNHRPDLLVYLPGMLVTSILSVAFVSRIRSPSVWCCWSCSRAAARRTRLSCTRARRTASPPWTRSTRTRG
jgi:serine/threonine protein kinase